MIETVALVILTALIILAHAIAGIFWDNILLGVILACAVAFIGSLHARHWMGKTYHWRRVAWKSALEAIFAQAIAAEVLGMEVPWPEKCKPVIDDFLDKGKEDEILEKLEGFQESIRCHIKLNEVVIVRSAEEGVVRVELRDKNGERVH